jgi:hypothetical protein
MWANLIVTALVTVFVAIAILGHVLVITALMSKPDDAKRAEAPAEPKDTSPAAHGLSTAKH